MSSPPSTRLHVFLAREAPFGLVLRRGPSQQVCTIGWNLTDDSFELGQWLKGRIYEHRCDLSPDGERFLYFAARYKQFGAKPENKHGAPTWSPDDKYMTPMWWTAVSRAPYLKALAMWGPENEEFFEGGGGQFINDRPFIRERSAEEIKARPGPLRPLAKPYLWGESEYKIYFFRLRREGWEFREAPEGGTGAGRLTLWEKELGSWTLQQFARYGDAPPGRGTFWQWYQARDTVTGETLGGQEWEWANFAGDRLVWAQGGQLFAMRLWEGGHGEATLLADFNDWKFRAIQAPY